MESSTSETKINPIRDEKLHHSQIHTIDHHDDEPIDPHAEKKLLWKVDLHLVPPLTVLVMLAFLDRINIGNAKIQGLTKELNMKGHDYSIALLIFFVPYILFEVPANLMMRRIKPSTWLCGLMFFWGVVTVCEGVVKNFASLVALRFLLGVFEAGFIPGAVYLISMYYERYELQWRLSIFFSASILAGAFGGLFAYALAHMNGLGGYSGWRWIFIMEGLLTAVVAVICKFIVVDWPELATFLTPQERALLIRRLKDDTGIARMDTLNRASAKRIFLDWKIYCNTVMYMGIVASGYATNFFIPTILQELGYTAGMSQVRTIPIYCVAAVAALSVAWISDRLRHRFGFTILGVTIAGIGYIILLCQEHLHTGVKYMACFFIVSGGYVAQPVMWSWLNNNMGGHYKRSVATAMQIGVGNLGGIVASNVFITNQAPLYKVGYGVCLAMILLCGVACTVFYLGLRLENAKRDGGGRDYRYENERADLENMGDDHPEFRYTL